MRLKGGKVLLDLTSLGDVIQSEEYTFEHPITNVEYRAILEKGLAVKLLFNGLVAIFDLIINAIDVSGDVISYQSILESTLGAEQINIYLQSNIIGIERELA